MLSVSHQFCQYHCSGCHSEATQTCDKDRSGFFLGKEADTYDNAKVRLYPTSTQIIYNWASFVVTIHLYKGITLCDQTKNKFAKEAFSFFLPKFQLHVVDAYCSIGYREHKLLFCYLTPMCMKHCILRTFQNSVKNIHRQNTWV